MHKHNARKVKKDWTYDVKEIADLLNVHSLTVLRWIRSGKLALVKDTKNPYLVRGTDLLAFLMEGQKKQKCPVRPGEFFCMKCRASRKSRPECVRLIRTKARIGNGKFSAIKIGICDVCGSKMNQFCTYKQDGGVGVM